MKLIFVFTLYLSLVVLQTGANPVRISKPRALVASREERSVSAAQDGNHKEPSKPHYLLHVVPAEESEFDKLMDFFAVGEIDSPTESVVSPLKNSYGSYEPRQDDLTEELLPPPVEQAEPNYYAVKPRKTKKYTPSQKLINIKNSEHYENSDNANSKGQTNEGYFLDEIDLDKLLASAWLTEADADVEAKGHSKELKNEELNTGEFMPSQQRRVDENTKSLPSENDGARVDYQLHGHKGPDSYAFGYDTGRSASFT
ncbi:uncharacterized protein LOC129776371 isoform X2 [Toxorhynchites rutilus septentrionalis]|uniref:uncharacterized protein LOC129776371 isoform X2 n=1 Tax=Toxorhynchites rutilus septentrionalis TaxID=329112 RepID=UPI0024789627|nr:uncharacterized protein LOC129776371 isoform X2 [Toxorhynchites rutilus septentrionalis]